MSDETTIETPAATVTVEPDALEDANAAYVVRARDVLNRLECMPMSSHETRLLKEALLTVFGPAIEEAAKHVKASKVE